MTKRWRLMIFDAPASHGGLLARHDFQPTKKNPNHWWRVFDPATDRPAAEAARSAFLSIGLKGKWSEVEHKEYRPARMNPGQPQYKPRRYRGYTDFSAHNTTPGNWRLKNRRR